MDKDLKEIKGLLIRVLCNQVAIYGKLVDMDAKAKGTTRLGNWDMETIRELQKVQDRLADDILDKL